MANVKEIMFTFIWVCIARYVIIVIRIQESLGPASQHLVNIGLVGYVIDNLILRRVEDVMEGYNHICRPHRRAKVATLSGNFCHQCLARFLSQAI